MIGSFSDHFSGVSGAYAEFRPRYPEALFDWLADLVPRGELALDCATGSGQAALALASRFERVVATDASTEQIAAATPHPRVEYRVARAEDSGLAADSVDLVTVAQALHWFDRPAFYREASRVLRRDGALAVWTYGHPRLDTPDADEVFQRFYSGTVGPFWPPERALVDAGYRTIDFPFLEVEPPAFEMETRWPLGALLGYVGTWSATTRFREAKGFDPIPRLATELAAAWGDREEPRRIGWPLSLRVGRRGR
ncbi:MAG: class I SAM-dependent methyltransferase [Acidobacteriota bacterium]